MDITSIEYFIKMCESKTMTEAANSIFITQSALSQSIASFERYCGCKLFERVNIRLKSHYYTTTVLNDLIRHSAPFYYFVSNVSMLARPERLPDDPQRIVFLEDPELLP